MKRLTRRFAVWLRAYTDKWVVGSDVHALVAEGSQVSLYIAQGRLAEAEHNWPNDPEIIYVQTLISFLKGDNK